MKIYTFIHILDVKWFSSNFDIIKSKLGKKLISFGSLMNCGFSYKALKIPKIVDLQDILKVVDLK